MAIPEECFDNPPKKPIWGGNNPTVTGEEYVLPEYVLGYVPQDKVVGTEEYFHNRQIIFNTEKKRAKYKYFFENGSEGKRIEFEERGIEE